MSVEADAVLKSLPAAERRRLQTLEAFPVLASTNSYLLESEAPDTGRFRVAIADHQTDGRGRWGKAWIAPPSSGVCLSVSFTFEAMAANLPSVTLAVGVAVAAALQTVGVEDVALKWPNDIVARDGKLGGILTELKSRSGGRTIVVGLGLNVDLPEDMRDVPSGNWTSKVTDLKECAEALPSRPLLIAGVLQCLFAALLRFEQDGFPAFRSVWQQYDWLKGKSVSIPQADGNVRGTADGLDVDGALLVVTDEGRRRVVTGSVTVTDRADGGA